MSAYRELLLDNPVTRQGQGAIRRFLLISASRISRPAALMIGLFYISLLYFYFRYAWFFGFSSLMLGGFVAVIAPILSLSGAIAGERENRTWDILRVAPVTGGQLVAGKFLHAARVISIVWIGSLPFYFLAATTPEAYRQFGQVASHEGLLACLMLGACLILPLSFLSASITLLASAAVRRPFQALMLSFGAQFCWLAAAPMAASVLTNSEAAIFNTFFFTLNPLAAFVRLTDVITPSAAWPPGMGGHLLSWLLCMALYPLLTLLFLWMAKKAMCHVDMERRLFQRRPHA